MRVILSVRRRLEARYPCNMNSTRSLENRIIKMDTVQLESLLHLDESVTLDFKCEQYRFARATEEDKSELVKDILGFANAYRRSAAYILIGVKEVRGGRSRINGVQTHLDDHSLQQFMKSLTNQPVRFHYETMTIEGKQIGIIQIDQQTRPLYLKKGYGKLAKEKVYVRRGSSTDPTKPATLEEIAQMRMDDAIPPVHLIIPKAEDGYEIGNNILQRRIEFPFTVRSLQFGCDPRATSSSGSSGIRVYIRSAATGEKRQVHIEHVLLPIGKSLLDATPLLVENPSGNALDLIGVDLMCAGCSVEGLFVYLTLAGSPPDHSSSDFTKKPRCGKRLTSSDSSRRRANTLRRWREKVSD